MILEERLESPVKGFISDQNTSEPSHIFLLSGQKHHQQHFDFFFSDNCLPLACLHFSTQDSTMNVFR